MMLFLKLSMFISRHNVTCTQVNRTVLQHNIRNGMLLTFKVVFVSVVFLAFAVELKCK